MKSILPTIPEDKVFYFRVVQTAIFTFFAVISIWRLFAWHTDSYDNLVVMGVSMANLTMILCGLLILVLWADSYANRSSRYFTILTSEVFILMFLESMYFINIGESTYIDLQPAVLSICSAMMPIILYTFWVYLINVTRYHQKFPVVRQKLMLGLMLVHYLMLIINAFTGWIYSFDEGGCIAITDYYAVLIAPLIAMSFIGLYDVLTRVSSKRQIIAMAVFLFLPWCGYAVDCYLDVGMSSVCFAIALIIIYCNFYVWRVEEIVSVESELKEQSTEALFSQIKPHFLYNSLTSIMNIPGTPADTREVISDFGKYLRGNIDSLVFTAPIPFRREIELTELYFEMVKLQFGDKLKLHTDLKTQDFQLPVMTIRTLASLCIEYGIAPKGSGTIYISTKETETSFEVRVADDGVGYAGTASDPYLIDRENVAGYSTVKKGLKDMMNASISYYSVKGQGTAFNIRVPKIHKAPVVPAYMRQRGS